MAQERYIKESEVAEQIAVAVQDAVNAERAHEVRQMQAVLDNLTAVATGKMRVVNSVPAVLPFRTTKDCWQWMTEQKERREQAETVAQIRLEHIQALMAEKAEQDELVVRQGREIVGLTDQVQRQSGMIKEGWDRINDLSHELVKLRERLATQTQTIDDLVAAAQAEFIPEPPPVEHVHEQNELVRKAEQCAEIQKIAEDIIKREHVRYMQYALNILSGHCE
jgi:hypothetical protein